MIQHSILRRGRAPRIPPSATHHPTTSVEWQDTGLSGILGLTELGPIQKFSCWMYFTLS